MQSFKKYALVPEENISKHVPSLEHMSELDREMQVILQNKTLTDYEKVRRYYEVLQKKFSLEKHNVPHIAIQEPMMDTQEETMEKQEPLEKASTQLKEIIMKSVPKHYRNNANDLIQLMEKHQNILNWNELGEVTYKGHFIKNSNVVDLFNHIFSPLSKSNPIGKKEFLNSLHDMNIPRYYIKNKAIVSHKPEISDDVQKQNILSIKMKKRNSPVINKWESY